MRGSWSGPTARDVVRIVLVPYVISRVLVIATLGVTREVVRDLATITDPIQVGQGLHAWDAAFYAAIARGGYDAVPAEGLRFFPLFPLLARTAAIVPGVNADLAVVLVANLCALVLGFVLYRLAFFERGDEVFARRAVWLLYLVPPAFVLVMGYAEATFMLLAVVVLLAIRRSQWLVAAGAALLAGACRPVGLLLVVPILVEALRNRRTLTGTDVAARVAAVVAPVAGCFAYLSWAADRTRSFLEPLRIQEDPSRRGSARFPVTNVIDVARDFSTGDHDTAGVHLLTIAVCIALLVVLARRWPASYTLYAASALVLALTARNLDSLERYMLSTAPFVLALADVVDTESRERVVLVLAAAGLVAAAALGVHRVARSVRFGRALLLIVLVAFGIRVAYVAVAKGGTCTVKVSGVALGSYPSECTIGDQVFYNSEADALARGDGFVVPLWRVSHPGEKPPAAADHPPLTAVVLAPVSWVVEHPPVDWIAGDGLDANVREHRYTMVLFGTLLVALVGLLGRRVAGDGAGLIAAGIAAVSPNIWVSDGLIMSETVMNVAVVATLLAAVVAFERPSPKRLLVVGVGCGFAALARAELLLLVPLLAIPLAWRSRPRLPALAAGVGAALVVIAPWVGYNLARFDDPTFLSTNDGNTLLGANCDAVYSGKAMGLWALNGATCTPPVEEGDQSVVSTRYRDLAFDYIRAHKRRLPVVALARIGRTWSLYRPADMIQYNKGEGREAWVTRLGLVAFYPTLFGAIAGVVVLLRRRARGMCWILCVPVITVTLMSGLTYGQTRFRAAAEPSLAVLAAVALVAAIRWTTSRSGSSAGGEAGPGNSREKTTATIT